MAQLNQQTSRNIGLDENAELGYGCLLVAEDEAGGYEPVALVSTLREARDWLPKIFDSGSRMSRTDAPFARPAYATWVRRSCGYMVLTST
jgi:hypothetical protein